MKHNTKLDVVFFLLNRRSHVRSIAKSIRTPHPTVSRKLDELRKENAVDFSIEGRNKIFFLRKTLSAKNYIHMAHLYKTNMMLKKYPWISEKIESVVKKSKIVVVAGKYAEFTAKKGDKLEILSGLPAGKKFIIVRGVEEFYEKFNV